VRRFGCMTVQGLQRRTKLAASCLLLHIGMALLAALVLLGVLQPGRLMYTATLSQGLPSLDHPLQLAGTNAGGGAQPALI
jgi:hypothetical protein